MKETIHILYTNDLHSYFDHWSRVATFVKSRRDDAESRGEFHMTVDIGDHMDRVHPLTEATLGRANVDLLNALSYNVATLGNNEGITLAHEGLYHLYDEADFHVVCSNLECVWSDTPSWLEMHHIEDTPSGLRIGFIGLTARFNPYYHLLGWNVTEVFQAVERELGAMRDKADIFVLLSHVGIYLDEQIAGKFSALDVIIGGHTHHLLREGEIVGETILTAAGKQCYYAGEVTLVYDHDAQMVVEKAAQAVPVEDLPRDLETEELLEKLNLDARGVLDEVLCTLDTPIETNWFKETPFMRKFTEQLRLWTDADIGMLNAGLLVEPFEAGPVTYGDVHRICPHPINPVVVSLTGEQVMHVVESALSKELVGLKLRGFGFRGEVVGRLVFANLHVETYFDEDGVERVEEVLFDGVPLEPKRTYRLATGDMFSFGRLMPEIANAEEKQLFLPEFIRKILVHTLMDW